MSFLSNLFKKPELSELEILIQSSSTHFHNKEYQLALQDYTEIIDLYPDCVDAYRERAATYYHLNRFDDALTDHNTYMSHFKKDPYQYKYRALLKCHLGLFDQAVLDLIVVTGFNVENDPLWQLIGQDKDLQKYEDKIINALTVRLNMVNHGNTLISTNEANLLLKRFKKLFF